MLVGKVATESEKPIDGIQPEIWILTLDGTVQMVNGKIGRSHRSEILFDAMR